MIYKKIEIEEMEHFWSLLNALDAETTFYKLQRQTIK